MAHGQADQNAAQSANHSFMPSARAATEKKMGILHSIASAKFGWHGEVRKRFTDFQVNERRKDGQVLHLTDYSVGERPPGSNIHVPGQHNQPKPEPSPIAEAPPAREITEEDKNVLQDLLGDVTAQAVLTLYDTIIAAGTTRLDSTANSVKFPQMEREVRGKVHQEIRRIFDSRLETETGKDGFIIAVPAPPPRARKSRGGGGRGKRSNQLSFNELGGDYLHFTLYKENKDTMDAVNQIGRILKVRPNNFGFAGTKDRRAATVQRMSISRVRHEVLDFLNGQIPALKMGDYKYSKFPIQLGDHGGNQFNITIKNVTLTQGQSEPLEHRLHLTKQAVEIAVTEMAQHGFINYYGLQRFGTHMVGTHELGMLILKEDYESVTNALLDVDQDLLAQISAGTVQETPMNRDDINRVRAIVEFKKAGNPDAALAIMPRRFSAEMNIIEHLSKNARDFVGAILRISRGMRNLYLHAYQSFVWNHAASYRWEKYGAKVIPGDLVLVTTDNTAAEDLEDESRFQRARPVSEEEAASGKYSIFDVVLPGPGFDVEYPKNDIGQYYVDFMKKAENGGLDPHHMRRSVKDFNISGNYRHLLGRFKGEPKWEVRTYVDDNEQMSPTDLDLITIRKEEENKKRKAQAMDDEDAKTTRVPAPTGIVRPLESESNGATDQAEQPSSKRVKLAEEAPTTTSSTDDAAAAAAAVGAPASTDVAVQIVEPIRQPTVPDGSPGFVTTQTDISGGLPAVQKAEEPTVARFGQGSIQSFKQADLSSYSEDQIKIAVVLDFGLSISAYATVVLRELMADVKPE